MSAKTHRRAVTVLHRTYLGLAQYGHWPRGEKRDEEGYLATLPEVGASGFGHTIEEACDEAGRRARHALLSPVMLAA